MRDKKISILLFVSFLLLLTSFLILCTWVYNYYSSEKKVVASSAKTDPVKSEITRDSLLNIYTRTIQNLESQLGSTYTKSDSIESRLSIKLDEYYRLKDELVTLLKTPSSNDDFKTAKQKINELQQRMEELRSTSADVEEENSRLYKLVAQINKDRRNTANIQYLETKTNNITKSTIEDVANKNIIPFSSMELNISAVKDEESEEADVFNSQKKIVGSFALKHALNFEQSEVMVVVIQPNGLVLQKSAWESGSFQSQDGKKIYSLKMIFGYNRGEAKRFSFSIVTDKFSRGNYTMQLFNNGILIGKLTKLLS